MRSWKLHNIVSLTALVAGAYALTPVAAAQAPTELEPAFLEASVNGVRDREPLLVLRGDDGGLYVPQDKVKAWRMRLPASRTIQQDGEVYVDFSNVEGLSFTIAEEMQSLAITASPEIIARTTTTLWEAEIVPMTKSAGGGFLNYELLGDYASGAFNLSGLFEAGIFSRHGYGTSTFAMRSGSHGTDLTRLDTSWTIDDANDMRSLRIGDAVSAGGAGGPPLRFGGVQFGSNFGIQPGFVTIPLPTLEGSAALPSVVDVYVNDTLLGSTEVAPGPFSITDIPVITGGGDVQLVVRDMLGRESAITQSYYTSPSMLRRGLHEHSSEIGFLRQNYGRRSHDYGAIFASTTHRYGLSDNLTAEAHVQGTPRSQSAGVAGALLLPGVGLLEASAALSRHGGTTGQKFGFGFERRASGLSFGARTEFASRDYRSIGTPGDRLPPAKTVQLFAGAPLGSGSLGLSYTLRDARSEPDAEIVSANASFRVKDLGSFHVAARADLKGKRETGIEVGLVIPFGPRSSASAGVRRDAGRSSLTADFQKNLPAGEGMGYRFSAATGELDRLGGRLSVQTKTGNYDGQVAMVDGRWGARAAASGAIAYLGGDVFAARRLTESFAVVKVGEFENVQVYADNQPVGTTNKEGVAIIPRLRPFDSNVVRVELADLPIDAAIAESERVVRPYDRSGIAIRFDAELSRSAILRIWLPDGSAVPAGSAVSVNGGSDSFVVAPGGETFLTGLGRRNLVQVTFDGGDCAFAFDFPSDQEDPQPDLGDFTCSAN